MSEQKRKPRTSITLSPEFRVWLLKKGRKGESYEDTIKRLIAKNGKAQEKPKE